MLPGVAAIVAGGILSGLYTGMFVQEDKDEKRERKRERGRKCAWVGGKKRGESRSRAAGPCFVSVPAQFHVHEMCPGVKRSPDEACDWMGLGKCVLYLLHLRPGLFVSRFLCVCVCALTKETSTRPSKCTNK